METLINGVKTFYQTFGEGKTFLILHGWGSNSGRWDTVAEKISEKGFRVIVPDLPGFGKSEVLSEPWTANRYISWLENFVRELNLEEFYLAGHSFGGALSVKFAIKYPQKVKKLFLIAAAFVRKKTIKKQVLGRLSKIAKLFSFLPFYSLAQRAFYKFVVGSSDYLRAEGVMRGTFLNVTTDDLSQFVGFVRVPTIIIWGNEDDSTLIDDAYFMEEKIRGSKLFVIDGAGHNLHRESPDILAEKILKEV